MANYSYKYPLLNDSSWLYQKYIVEQLSLNNIVPLVGAKTTNSISQALRRFDIPVRTKSEGLTNNRVSDGFVLNQEVIDGCLLGDGYLTKWNKQSDNSFPIFKKRNANKDHVEYVSTILGLSLDNVKFEQTKLNGKLFDAYILRTLAYKELLPIYKKWYPEDNNFKKVVPSDIIITPTVLLHWFMDDGCTWIRKDRKGTPIVGAISSESFSKEDNMMLIEKIYSATGLKLTPNKSNSGTTSRLSIPTSQIKLFYDVIGNCPVESLNYKWKETK